jgi:hypothetical protein
MIKKWFIAVLVVVIILIAGAFGTYYFEDHIITKNERATVTTLVENFASKMKDVSLKNSEDKVISEMKNAYSPFISKTLMEEWERNPSKIIGRPAPGLWPEKIEIDSIKKRSKYYIDVKGKIIYVTSGNGKLVETGETPVKIVVRRISKKGGYQIDWIEHGKYVSAYNGKQLLAALKEAFPNMEHIGETESPFVVKTVDFTGDGTPEAIVDMAYNGASFRYYTVCQLKNGVPKVVKFKDAFGKITYLHFKIDDLPEHSAELKFTRDEKGNFVLYLEQITRNSSGEVANVAVEAYKWNNAENLFEYDNEFSSKLQKTLENQLIPKSVLYSDLKAKEIKTEFPSILAVFPYNDEVVFSCGSGKMEQGFPPANINHIVVYDTKAGKVEYSQEISENWMRIDKVQMNGNWILFRAVLDKADNNATCFTINRKTGRRADLLNIHKGFKVNDMLLQGDYATLIIEKHEDKSNSKITELIRINLKSGEEQKYLEQKCFESAEKNFTASRIWGIEGDSAAISVSKMENGSERNYVYLYSFTGRSSATIEIPKYISAYTIPPDGANKIIYLRKNEIVIAPLRKPNDFEEIGLTVFRPSTLVNDTCVSKDYIVVRLGNGDIFVYNRKTKNRTIIKKGKIQMTANINLNGDTLAAVNHLVNAPDGVIFMNLKEEGL